MTDPRVHHIESVWYTPDETATMLDTYQPTGQFHFFVFFGVEVPFNTAIVRISMTTIRKIRAADGTPSLSIADEEEMIKAFLLATATCETLLAARAIWLLAQNNIPGLGGVEAVPEKDCISIRIVFEGETTINTIFSQFTIDELMESAAAAVAKKEPF